MTDETNKALSEAAHRIWDRYEDAKLPSMKVGKPNATPTRVPEPTPGPYIIVDGTVIASLAPVPYGWEISAWYDYVQADGPDCRFVAETATDTDEGRANAVMILEALNALALSKGSEG